MINAHPIAFCHPGNGGPDHYVREEARLEIALVAPANEGAAPGIELSIWTKSGRFKVVMAAPSAMAAAQDVSRILSALYPHSVSIEAGS